MVIQVVAIDTFSDNDDSDLGLKKAVLTPQHVPFQFGKPGESLPDIYTSQATTKSMSLQVAIPQRIALLLSVNLFRI
ncbi:unnamed protein product [Brassica rapa subsp. trilocularis]